MRRTITRRSCHVSFCLAALVAGATVLPGSAPAGTVDHHDHQASSAATAGLVRRPVQFTVKNPGENDAARTVAGYRYDPACKSTTAVLFSHGLSYTGEAWDLPGYSVVQPFAQAGYTAIAVDRLGYGKSKLEDGYKVSSEAYAKMTDQIISQLRAEGFAHVALVGHSAGSEVSELTAGLYGTADAVAALGYHHRPSDQLGKDFFTGDNPRALQGGYEYFLGTPEHRTEMFFTEHADPAVVAADRDAAVLTPSGEILSIGKQPSRYVLSQIKAPVYLQLGDSDLLFETQYLDWEKMQLSSAKSVTVDIVPGSGHTHMIHHAGPEATGRLVKWFQGLPETPPCG